MFAYPRTKKELDGPFEQVKIERIGDRFLGPGHLLVVPTRIALSDHLFEAKRVLRAALNQLDAKVIEIAWLHFDILARCHVTLACHFASQLPPELANRASIEFIQNKGAFYTTCERHGGGGRQRFTRRNARTAGYVLHVKRVPSLHGADLVVLFGMGGVETLVLAHHLRTTLSRLLAEPVFAMIEFTNAVRPDRPEDTSFARLWRPQIVLEAAPLLPERSCPEAAVARLLAGPSAANATLR